MMDILSRLKLLSSNIPCNAAEVMFGKALRLSIQMAAFASEEKLTFNDIKRHNGTISELVSYAERYIRNTIRWRVVFDGSLQRIEIPEIPMDAIREALQNSFAHKDFLVHQNNEVAIFSNRIEIYNPGTFPVGLMPEDFINSVQNSIHRNPLIADLMYYVKDIESFGTGLRRIADACKEAEVKYEFDLRKYGFAVIFYRKPLYNNEVTPGESEDEPVSASDEPVNEPVSASNEPVIDLSEENNTDRILAEITKSNTITYEGLAEILKVSRSSVKRHIKKLKEDKVIERVGSDKTGRWEIIS